MEFLVLFPISIIHFKLLPLYFLLFKTGISYSNFDVSSFNIRPGGTLTPSSNEMNPNPLKNAQTINLHDCTSLSYSQSHRQYLKKR